MELKIDLKTLAKRDHPFTLSVIFYEKSYTAEQLAYQYKEGRKRDRADVDLLNASEELDNPDTHYKG